jgi:CRISPR-associated endonuclease Csn1
MSATGKRDLVFSFDVGHSSIGWNVLKETDAGPEEIALGTVIFEADGCLASKRRTYRRMRRTIRSRRQRVEAIEKLFAQQGILSRKQIEEKHAPGKGNSAPWLLAAAVLSSKGKFALKPDELFDVIRWYAHNRGYDGNRRWAGNAGDEGGDSDREKAAFSLMDQHKTTTMAETVCAQLGLQPDGHKKAAMAAYKNKEIGAAFPRKTVVSEVRQILGAHVGKLKGCTPEFIEALCGDLKNDWQIIPIPEFEKQKTYRGGLLFGQKVPRFDNRILSFCPVTDTPTPLKSAKEFLEFRCAMFLSNVRVGAVGDSMMRPLTQSELADLWQKIHKAGYLTEDQFKKTIRGFDGVTQDNLDALMTIEDTAKNLVVDPPLKLLSSSTVLKAPVSLLSAEAVEELLSILWKKNSVTLADILANIPEADREATVDAAFKKDKAAIKKYGTKERWLEGKTYHAEFDSGRAPYARAVMQKAVEEILNGLDPRAKGGCLYLTDEMLQRQEDRSIDELTNNHLVRHRLLILQRLFKDMVDEFCGGDRGLVQTVVVEVNREVSEMSGKTNKQIAQEEGLKRADHKKAVEKLEEAVKESGEPIKVTAGLIRKARIAQDLGWTCPYTGEKFSPMELIYGQVDLDHIIPRSERLSDSMAGLVVTFSEVNRWKGKRSALQFVTEEQGRPVQGKGNLRIQPLADYQKFVSGLKTFGGHASDEARRKSRKAYLMLPSYEDKEFTPRDLTISSYVAKLAVQQLKKEFKQVSRPPQVISLPGRLTGEARKAWKLTGLLKAVHAEIKDETTKDEIRGLTHLHHALDAAVMGLMAHCTGNLSDGTTWQLLLKRSLLPHEKNLLQSNMSNIAFDGNRAHLLDVPDELKEQLRKRLLERRVVQHVPASMEGMRVDENTSGVIGFDEKTGKVKLHQFGKPTESRVPGKLLGYEQSGSKLWKHRGVRIITENFGVALASEPEVIRWHKVYPHLSAIEAKDGKWPVVWRRGQIIIVPEGRQKGVWRISGIDENMRDGIIIKICSLDGLERAREARIKSLLRSKAHLVKTRLTGDEICRITSSTSGAQVSG